MTIITKLELKNFKSFKKAEIPFAEGFTAIAGANASGKSNILDALLFSMGITSLKQLRASRLTELVNHDAKESYAKAELTVKDDNGREIVVTRLIDKMGKSIYKLDGKRKTLGEIQALLLEIGINPNGHNIVVQGDITRIIEMNPKQRRQIIEEVAGLQEFEEKKEEALKKLEKVEQRVKDTNLVLNERENYLKQLEKERENALRFQELQKEIKQSKATILSEEIKIIKTEIGNADKKMKLLEKEINDKRNERDKLQDEERELEKKVEDATKNLINASEKAYSSVGKELEQKKGELNLVNERIQNTKYSLTMKTESLKRLGEEEKELTLERASKEDELKNAALELEKIREQIEGVKRNINAKSPSVEKKKDNVKSHEEELMGLNEELHQAREELHSIAMQKNGIERDVKSAENSLEELGARLKKLEQKLLEKKEFDKKIRELEAKSPEEKLETIEKEIEKAHSEIHNSHGKIANLEESLDRLAGAKSSCPTCDKPLEEKRKKEISEKRKGEIGLLKARIRELEDTKKIHLEKKARVIAEARELSEARFRAKSFSGIEEDASELRERIAGKKQIVLEKGKISSFEKKEKELNEKISETEKKRNAAQEKIMEFRKSELNTEFNKLVTILNELTEKKTEKDLLCSDLSADIDKVISKRIAAIKGEKEKTTEEKNRAEEREKQLSGEAEKLAKLISEMGAELEKANKANRLLEEEKNRLTEKIKSISEKRDNLGRKTEALEKEMNETNIQLSRNDVRIVDLEEEFKEYSGVTPFVQFILNDLKKQIPELEKEIEKMGAINMKALQDFEEFRKEVDMVREKAMKLDEERKAVLEMIDKIEVRKMSVFMDCFEHVAKKFSELYYNFFEGEGRLDLSDTINPFEGGLLIHAKYKEDMMKSIDAMSGGEKSLTAMAFLFAIQSFEPAPFYILDEVDAALDKENSIKVGKMIMGQGGQSQFIVISHNDSVINQADQIIGVALNKQKSSIIGLKLKRGQKYESEKEEDAEETGSG